MAQQFYLPGSDDARAKWLLNFVAKLAVYAGKYSITDAEQTAMGVAERWFTGILAYLTQFQSFTGTVTSFKNALRNGLPAGQTLNPLSIPTPELPGEEPVPGIFIMVAAIVNKIKLNPAYSVADGTDMGIEGTEIIPPDPATLTPVLSTRPGAGGHPDVKWPKQNMPQLELHADRGTGLGWVKVDTFTQAHFIDPYPLPAPGQTALWRYRGIFCDHNQQMGQWSAIAEITVKG